MFTPIRTMNSGYKRVQGYAWFSWLVDMGRKMTLHGDWQVRCTTCDRLAEPTGHGTVDIEHDLRKHEEMAPKAMSLDEEGRAFFGRNVDP
ncbi:hypothetical protein [Streptomyces sp. NPDC056690]|uniref:hypothetical protein n=1 Tax=unclassified Streptomyces TaxID=2593676 RepID=UPI00363147CA